jgi:ribulose-phosphate 3-epimerase
MKISASLYSQKSKSILETVEELESYFVDYWHIDSIENIEVFEDIKKIQKESTTPIDLHIISKKPSSFYHRIEETRINRVSFQIEELEHDYIFPKFDQTKVGLAIQIGHTDIDEKILQYHDSIDFVLLMMTTPGISGGQFDKNYFSKIRALVERFPYIQWCVDGGVNHEISYILRLIGIQSIVVGSYLMNQERMAQAILQIRSHRVKSDYLVEDYCISTDNLPLISLNDSLKSMLEKMDKYKLGTVFCLGSDNKFVGIITNADIRKELITGNFNYQNPISNLINTNPKSISATQSTAEMIDYIDSIPFPILVLPIIAKNGTLAGAISFHKLLKED